MASNDVNQPLSRRVYNSGRRRNTDGSIAYDPRQTTQAYAQPENGIPEPVRGIRRSGSDAGYQPAIPNKSQPAPLRTAQPDIRQQAINAIGKANPQPVQARTGIAPSQPQVTQVGGWNNATGGDFGDYVRTPEGEQVGKASATKDASGAWRRIGSAPAGPVAPPQQSDPTRPIAQPAVIKDSNGKNTDWMTTGKKTQETMPPEVMGPPATVPQVKKRTINGQPVADALRTAKSDADFAELVTPAMARQAMTDKVMPGGQVDDAALMREAKANLSRVPTASQGTQDAQNWVAKQEAQKATQAKNIAARPATVATQSKPAPPALASADKFANAFRAETETPAANPVVAQTTPAAQVNIAPQPSTSKVKKYFPGNYPMVKNSDGSYSNVKLMGVGFGNREYVIPTMENGVDMSPKEAIATARKNGLDNYPSFATPEEGSAWAEKNHGNINEDGTLKDSETTPNAPVPTTPSAKPAEPQQTATTTPDAMSTYINEQGRRNALSQQQRDAEDKARRENEQRQADATIAPIKKFVRGVRDYVGLTFDQNKDQQRQAAYEQQRKSPLRTASR